MLNKITNKILGGTVNTTDNQVTAQVKAEPTVAKPATRIQLRLKANINRPAAALIHTPPCWRGSYTVNMQLVKVKAQHVNAVQILVQMQMVVVLIRHAVQIQSSMLSKVKVKNVQNVNPPNSYTTR